MEENKKAGQRDISDLKARLGLKKPGAASSSDSEVAPSQAAAGMPTPPKAPADPKRDPFASAQAANLAAFYGVGQTIPGSADAVAGGEMQKKTASSRAILVAAVLVGVFIIGSIWGKIAAGRENLNLTIDQSALLKVEVEGIAKQLKQVAEAYAQSAEARKGNPDVSFAEKLKSLSLKAPDTHKLFHTNYYFLEDLAIDRLMTYYNDNIKLIEDVKRHANKTEADADAIANYLQKGGAKANDKNFGVTLDFSGAVPLSHFVEVGSPVCVKPGQTDCNAKELKGFKYRTDAGAAWNERPIKGPPQDVLYPIQRSPFFASVAAGDPDVLAARDCVRRQASIAALLANLAVTEKQVISDLQKSADRKHVFAF